MTAPASPDHDHRAPRAERRTTHDTPLRPAAPIDVATIQATISEVLHGPVDFASGSPVTVWWELLTGHAQLLMAEVRDGIRSQWDGRYAEAAAACVRCTAEALAITPPADHQVAFVQTRQLARAVAALLGFAVEVTPAQPRHHDNARPSA
ncbi:DUF6415 family natural product biosynthesis protein [Streptomyces diastatochromogenes]|uniref:DUF6415 family natural product biosynthesis protein n=3 Tax=Streptomyces TaxID=1883 RepID=UPI002F269767